MAPTKLEPIDWARVAAVLAGCVAVIVATGAVAFAVRTCPPGPDGGKKCPTLGEWFDQDTSAKAILVGAAAGAAFGVIDNTLLYVGMSSLETVFARLPGGRDPLVLAGYGNAFSSVVSIFVSTFVGRWIASVYHLDIDRAPLWSSAVGILVGCVVAIAVPQALARR